MIEKDIERFRQISRDVTQVPEVAITLCIGRNSKLAEGHRPFVVLEKAPGEKFVWKPDSVAEYSDLDEALSYPEAQPYGSTMYCTACKSLPFDFVFDLRE